MSELYASGDAPTNAWDVVDTAIVTVGGRGGAGGVGYAPFVWGPGGVWGLAAWDMPRSFGGLAAWDMPRSSGALAAPGASAAWDMSAALEMCVFESGPPTARLRLL